MDGCLNLLYASRTAPHTGHFIMNVNLTLTVLEAGGFRMKASASAEDLLIVFALVAA